MHDFFGNVCHYTLLNTTGLGYAQCYTQLFGYTQCYAQLFLVTHNIMHNFWLGTSLHTTFFVRHFIMHNIFCQAHYYAQLFWQCTCTLLNKALLLTHIVKHNLFWLCTMLAQQFFWLCILCKLEVKSERKCTADKRCFFMKFINSFLQNLFCSEVNF